MGTRTALFVRKQNGGMFGIEDQAFTTGNRWYLDSTKTSTGGDTTGHGQNPDSPFLTLDYAIGNMDEDSGDTLFVAPGHTETLTGDSAVDLDKKGIKIIGLGYGLSRPTFLLDGSTAVDIEVAADDVWLDNLIFKFGHADAVECFDIGAAKDFHVSRCSFFENTSGENCKIIFNASTTNNAADGLHIEDCYYYGPDTANTSFVKLGGDIDRMIIQNNYVSMGVNNSNAVIEAATGKDMTNVQILSNRFYRLNTTSSPAIFVSSDTDANSGIIAYNVGAHADTGSEIPLDCGGAYMFENYFSGVTTASGYILPAIDS